MSNPSKEHFKSLNNLWSYLNRTQNLAIKIARNNPTNSSNQPTPYNLEGYSDVDWGGDYVSRRSTTGYTFYLNNYLISWYSKLQHTVALSSCEVEYMAIKEAVKEQLFIKSLIS